MVLTTGRVVLALAAFGVVALMQRKQKKLIDRYIRPDPPRTARDYAKHELWDAREIEKNELERPLPSGGETAKEVRPPEDGGSLD